MIAHNVQTAQRRAWWVWQDWAKSMAAVESDPGAAVVPRIIRQAFATAPEGLIDPDAGGPGGPAASFVSRGYGLRDDATVLASLQSADVVGGVYDSLDQTQHWQHASTRFREGNSLEVSARPGAPAPRPAARD